MTTLDETPARVSITRDLEVPFTLVRAEDDAGDGLTLTGYAAVFNRVAHIEDQDGIYDEVIKPGAFKRTLDHNPRPPLMFEHGRHPLIGKMPIGAIRELGEDPRGLYVRARLFDNWMIEPLRDAIRNEAVSGMSFRFEIPRGGAEYTNKGGTRLRSVREAKLYELGPVVFPAYAETTLALRSLERNVPHIHVTVDKLPTLETLERGEEMTTETVEDGKAIETFTLDGEVRSDDTFDDIANAVDDAIENALGIDDYTSDVCICDMSDTWAVYRVMGALEDDNAGYWQVDYTYDAATVSASVSEPRPVKRTYSPRDKHIDEDTSTRDATTDPGTSEEPATDPGTSTEPAIEEREYPLTFEGRKAFLRKLELDRRGIRPGAQANG